MSEVIFIAEKNVRDAWLNAVFEVMTKGINIKTEYDIKRNIPPSKDATVLVNIKNPLSEPVSRNGKIVKVKTKFNNSFEMYGELADTYLFGSIKSGYIEEVLDGTHDHYLEDSDKSFPYSYHDRIFNYTPYGMEDISVKAHNVGEYDKDQIAGHQKLSGQIIEKTDCFTVLKRKDLGESIYYANNNNKPTKIEYISFPNIDQIELMIKKLKETPYSRRTQAITWRPLSDPFRNDPPCLQRIWCRIYEGKLSLQTTWRSRDLFRAWEANVNGMIYLQKRIAEELNVEVGNYVDFSNSLHIYGVSLNDVFDMFERIDNKNNLPTKLKRNNAMTKLSLLKFDMRKET